MTPRIKPDGTVRLVNIGTVEEPNIVAAEQQKAPGQAALDAAMDLREFATALGVADEDADAFVTNWIQSAKEITEAPKKELLFRLNCQVRGEDPGEPVNWPGLRGFRA